jgi:hypothetical protein
MRECEEVEKCSKHELPEKSHKILTKTYLKKVGHESEGWEQGPVANPVNTVMHFRAA